MTFIGRTIRIITMIAIVGLISTTVSGLMFTNATAQTDTDTMVAGTGPGNATAPTGRWTTIGPDETHWYTFSDAGEDTRVDVRLNAQNQGRLTFEVWTEQQLNKWADDIEFDPLGAGTPNEELEDSDLSWRGSFGNAADYYVIVRQMNPVEGETTTYNIEATGQNVTFPQATPVQPESTAVTAESNAGTMQMAEMTEDDAEATQMTQTSAQIAMDTMVAGTGPGSATAPVGRWTEIGSNETHWYVFNEGGDDNAATVRLNAQSDGRLSFEIWTERQLNKWADGVEFDPLGAGTPNEELDSDLSWRGSFENSGTFYIVVEQTNPVAGETITYNIEARGRDVSF